MQELSPDIQPFFLWLSLILGMCIGSFLNVVGHRLLAQSPDEEEESEEDDGKIVSPLNILTMLFYACTTGMMETLKAVSYPPSHCPQCQTPIRPQDNIPVLSYLMLGGQCRQCKKDIHAGYPLIELATGVLFALTVWRFGVTLQSAFLLFLVANMMVVIITDNVKDRAIFLVNSLPLIPVGIVYNLLNLGNVAGISTFEVAGFTFDLSNAFVSCLLAIVVPYVFFEGSNLLSRMFVGQDGFGDGDTHLMMGVGAFLGWELALLALVLGLVLQTVLAVPMLVYQWFKEKDYTSLTSGGVAGLFSVLPIYFISLPPGNPLKEFTNTACIICIVITLAALVVFLRQIKQKESLTYLPLGPALVLGTLISLFWGQPVISAILNVYTH